MCTMRMIQKGRLSTERSRSEFGVTQLAGGRGRNGSQCMLTVTFCPHCLLPQRFTEDGHMLLRGEARHKPRGVSYELQQLNSKHTT